MDHACQTSGLSLTRAADAENPRPGEYYHAASRDPSAPAGVIKVTAKSREDVCKLYTALHNQAIQVGQDMAGIQVVNDYIDLAVESGNDPRARA